jgi:hypothetical protein
LYHDGMAAPIKGGALDVPYAPGAGRHRRCIGIDQETMRHDAATTRDTILDVLALLLIASVA